MDRDDPRDETGPPALTPEQEARVRDLLAALGDVATPPDVAARLDAALAAAGADDDRARARRRPRLLQAAAVAAVLALGGAVAVVSLGGSDGRPATTAETATTDRTADAPVPETASTAAYVSPTGRSLGGDLDRRVRRLLAERERSLAQDGATPNGPLAAAVDGGRASTADAEHAAVRRLVRDPDRRAACVRALTGAAAEPLAAAFGVHDGRPAALLVVADEPDGSVVHAWVVGPGCGKDGGAAYRSADVDLSRPSR